MQRRIALLLSVLITLLGGLTIAGTADAAAANTYTVTRTFGPYNGAAKEGDPGSVPVNGEARNVSCNAGDTGLAGSATVNRKTSHGTAPGVVITLNTIGWYWNSEVDLLQYGSFVGTTGRPGWNSVTITATCHRHA